MATATATQPETVAEKAQAALSETLSAADCRAIMDGLRDESERLTNERQALDRQPITEGAPEQVAYRRIQSETLKAATEQCQALRSQYEGKLRQAQKREAIRDRAKLQATYGKKMQAVRKQAEALAKAWGDADEAWHELYSAHQCAAGIHGEWEACTAETLEQVNAALHTLSKQWQFEHRTDCSNPDFNVLGVKPSDIRGHVFM